MKHFIPAEDAFIEEFTNFDDINANMPNRLLTDHVEAVRDMRQMAKEISVLGKMNNSQGWTRGRNFQRVASIPSPILGAIKRIDPDFMTDKKKFFRWLDNHPEYDLRGKVGA